MSSIKVQSGQTNFDTSFQSQDAAQGTLSNPNTPANLIGGGSVTATPLVFQNPNEVIAAREGIDASYQIDGLNRTYNDNTVDPASLVTAIDSRGIFPRLPVDVGQLPAPAFPSGRNVVASEFSSRNGTQSRRIELEVKNSAPRPTADDQGLRSRGTVEVTLQATRSSGVESATGRNASRIGMTATAVGGARFTYEFGLSAEQFQAYRSGDTSGIPNPYDPLSMREGSSVLFRGQAAAGTDFEAAIGRVASETGITAYGGVGMSVERLSGSRVRISAGAINTVESNLHEGLRHGPNLSAGLHRARSLEDSRMRTAELDLSTPAGMSAYNRFLANGEIPSTSSGAVSTENVASSRYTNDLNAYLRLGNVELSGRLAQAGAEHKLTTRSDGTSESEISATMSDDRSLNIRRSFDANRQETAATFSLILGGVDAGSAAALRGAFSENSDSLNTPSTGNGQRQDVQLSFTRDQFNELRQRANEYLSRTNNINSDLSVNGVIRTIAESNSPEQMLNLLNRGGLSNAQIAHDLNVLRGFTGGNAALPGTLRS